MLLTRYGFAVERHFNHFQRRVPRVDLAAAGLQKCGQVVQEAAPGQAEHRCG